MDDRTVNDSLAVALGDVANLVDLAENKFLEGLTRFSRGPLPPISNPPHETPGQKFKVRGRVRFDVVGPDEETGKQVTKQSAPWVDNILTTYGLASMASAVGSSAAVTASFWIQAVYIGTSATAPTSTDTSLGASTASLTIGNASFVKTNTGAQTVEYQCTFASSNTSGAYTINEIGLYCNSTGNETQNHIAAHATLATAAIKGASDVLQASYQIIWTTA